MRYVFAIAIALVSVGMVQAQSLEQRIAAHDTALAALAANQQRSNELHMVTAARLEKVESRFDATDAKLDALLKASGQVVNVTPSAGWGGTSRVSAQTVLAPGDVRYPANTVVSYQGNVYLTQRGTSTFPPSADWLLVRTIDTSGSASQPMMNMYQAMSSAGYGTAASSSACAGGNCGASGKGLFRHR